MTDRVREALRAAVEKHCHCDTRWPATARIDDTHMADFISDLRAALASEPGVSETPAARWRSNGEADPTPQDYERARLPLGDYTDDELANAAYMTVGHIPENLSNAAKQRMRWLSRRLCEAEAKLAALSRQQSAAEAELTEPERAHVEACRRHLECGAEVRFNGQRALLALIDRLAPSPSPQKMEG